MMNELRKLLKVTGGGGRYLLLILLRSPVSIVMTAINAYFLQHVLDAIAQADGRRLTVSCIIFGIASFLIFLYNGILWSAFSAPAVTGMEGRLRVKLFCKICSLPCERIEARPQGEWLTRLNTDVQMPFSESWPQAVSAMINLCASSFILWQMNPAVFLLVILFVIPHIAVSRLLIARVMPDLNKKSLESAAKNTGELTALITCADITALYDGQDYLMKRFEQSSLNLLRANMKIRIRNALGAGILPLFGLGGYLILLIVGSGWIADGRFTFGDLTAAFQYRGGVLLGALTLINCLISIQAGMAGIRRLNETMEEKTEGEKNGG